MIAVVIVFVILLALCCVAIVVIYETQRHAEARRRSRVPAPLPWLFVVVEAVIDLLERIVPKRVFGVPDVNQVIADARAETGLQRFANEPFVRRQLALLLDALNDRTVILWIGRKHMVDQLRVNVATQLRLAALPRAVHDSQLPQRLIWIIGLPRSGTTRLFHLMSLDPRAQTVPYWQLVHALPTVGPIGVDYRTDARAQEMRRVLGQTPTMRFMEVHQFGADVPEEDDLLLQHSMLYPHVDTYELESELVLDEWHRLRCDDASMRAAYRDHRLLLQAIMSTRALDAASVCMLKSTVHGAFLDHLTGEHPQAVFVQTHRNAFDSVASMAYLRLCLNDTLMKSCDAPALAERILQFEAWHMQRLLAYRRSLPAADEARRFVDVHFDDIGADPIGVVEQIYAHFGFVVCDEHRQAMQSYIATHRSSSSTGRFDASQLFKLERSRVDAIFADYERFRASSIVKRKSGERRA